jgi:hypothetical protein
MTDKLALEFRTKGAALAKAKTEGFAGIYFGISTTLGTRIRCEVPFKNNTLKHRFTIFTINFITNIV